MVRRYLVPLAAFFVEPYPRALAVFVIAFDAEVDDRRDPREGAAHEADHRAIAEADDRICLDRIDESPRLVGGKDRRLSARDDMLRPPGLMRPGSSE
jgi:hypothetical protein